MQEEINVINHLLAVEKDAALLIDNAVKEADNRTAEARNKANAQFKQQYDECALQLQKEYEEAVNLKKNSHEKEMEQFKNSLDSMPRNYKAFDKVMDKLLSE